MSSNFVSIFKANFPESDYKSVFVYGSQVYGNTSGLSDVDYLVVSDSMFSTTIGNYINASCYSNEQFTQMIKDHDIIALEVLSLPLNEGYENFYMGEVPDFSIDLPTLRKAISSKASNSFVKAKKKLTVEKDYDFYCSMKSLFHSMRILDFGEQIATHGHIYNFKSCASLFYEIERDYKNCINTEQILTVIDKVYKPKYNNFATSFRKVCPKEIT